MNRHKALPLTIALLAFGGGGAYAATGALPSSPSLEAPLVLANIDATTSSTSSTAPRSSDDSTTSSTSSTSSTSTTTRSNTTTRDDDDAKSSTSSSSTTTRASSSTTTRPALAPQQLTLTSKGGTATFAFDGQRLTVVSAQPAAGFGVDTESEGREAKVRFENSRHRSEIKLEIEDGALRQRIREDARSSGSGSGSDDDRDDDDRDDDRSGSNSGKG